MDTSATLAKAPAGNLKFVLICVFIDLLGVGLIVPVLPALVGEYAHGREQQALWFGILAAVWALMQFLCMPVIGMASDRLGRRPVLLYSMAGMCAAFLSTALAPNLAWLFLGRVLGGASSASMAVASAYAADVSAPEERAKNFGKVGAAFGLGFICGPVLGGLLGNVGLHLPFYVAAALAAANFVYGAVAVPESLPAERRAPFRLARLNPFAALLRLLRRRDVRGLVAVYTLVSFAQMTLQATFVLYSSFRFGWTPRENGVALCCVGLTSFLVQARLLGPLIRRFGERRLALAGMSSGACAFLLYGLATRGWMLYAIILCNLLSFAVVPTLQGILSKDAAPREQGELMGSLQSIASLGLIVMPLVGTRILGAVGHLPPQDWRIGSSFYLCAAMQAAAILAAWRVLRPGAPATPAAPPPASHRL
ncbi:TCR/Tet family MFS transporter [Massilia forsythiae]|uniref:TCR/Tet family MFS transporter n=1 Tax=Massilia forsythiae TaxID=2728020 RepID=A0A7Z2W0U1_9BURK|nr:MFS transporter [Massilia forsythiae]QJE02685.1 TCR/Tet family MFS transporter [Massilia forsythiae]